MADETKPEVKAAAPPPDESVKNLKAEMDRKLGNIEKTNQALLSQLQVLAKPKAEPTPAKKPLRDIWYDDPEAAASLIAKQAKDETLSEIRAENRVQAEKNTVIQGLYREYPELADFDNPLTVKAVEYFEKLSDQEKANPIAYRLAVKEAAEDLEIKPKLKRKPKDDDDGFSLSGASGGGSAGKKARGSEKLDPRTVRFAEMVGLDTKDEKVLSSLKNRAERKNWMTWE